VAILIKHKKKTPIHSGIYGIIIVI